MTVSFCTKFLNHYIKKLMIVVTLFREGTMLTSTTTLHMHQLVCVCVGGAQKMNNNKKNEHEVFPVTRTLLAGGNGAAFYWL